MWRTAAGASRRRGVAPITAARGLHRSGAAIRRQFLEYFTERGHVVVRSSSVVPLCDPTVPFVNAGMNQFKGVFLGNHAAPHPRVVNSQKCVRVGGKHNDLDVVGTDGTHHTLFEMLGNWSFGDYYKKEACQLAWNLLTGPYHLDPTQLIVTYFGGNKCLGLDEDKETRDIWRQIGVAQNSIRPLGMADNFWEMGAVGPCGPCTEIHHVGTDGALTEVWNIVFIQYNREADGRISQLEKHHIDTGMGLERLTALLQRVPSNYDTDLFLPIIRAIEKESKSTNKYTGRFGSSSEVDCAYRCLADHSRMIAVCLADGMFPASSLNLKQIMRRSFKLSEDIFKCKPGLLTRLYDKVADILGPAYPEIVTKMADAKTIIRHEEASYAKLRSNLAKRWKELARKYPEVEQLEDVELSGFAEGYKQFKQAMEAVNGMVIPGEIVFKMYDAHGFTEAIIDRVATLNRYTIDKEGFKQLLNKHKSRHKSAFKEQAENRGLLFDKAVEKLNQIGIKKTNDEYKYKFTKTHGQISFPDLKTDVAAVLSTNGEWCDTVDFDANDTFYIVTKDTNFFCEEGGQAEDRGKIVVNNICLNCVSVFKIRDTIFHKVLTECKGELKIGDSVSLTIDKDRRLNCMRNHTATHLLNAAMKKVLSNSVTCQVGSTVSDEGFVFNMAVYGEKLTNDIVMKVQDMIRKTIKSDVAVVTSIRESVELGSIPDVLTVPGETYPDSNIRLVEVQSTDITSRELCCGTHVPSTGDILELCVLSVKGAGSHAPSVRAITGGRARELRELTECAQRLLDEVSSQDNRQLLAEVTAMRSRLETLSGTVSGAPSGQLALCGDLLDRLQAAIRQKESCTLNSLAEQEMRDQNVAADASGRPFIVHFLLCSYLMESANLAAALAPCVSRPAMVIGCANGVIKIACSVPEICLSKEFTAEKWLSCVLPIFKATQMKPGKNERTELFAAMTGTKVSLITCEGLVRDAMQAAAAFAEARTRRHDGDESREQLGRRNN